MHVEQINNIECRLIYTIVSEKNTVSLDKHSIQFLQKDYFVTWYLIAD